jgi:Helicase conserved C-terminal domain
MAEPLDTADAAPGTNVPRPDVERVRAGLKDFQLKTVDYVFERLYGTDDPTRRFLIADEVGLGKTLVARGVVAMAVDKLWDDPAIDRIDVVYVCSNGDIARQNVDRLTLPGWEALASWSRLTLLPMHIRHLRDNKLNFVSFTPGTSFDLKSSMGKVEERALLFWLLRDVWPVAGTGPLNLLQGYANGTNFREYYVAEIHPDRDIDPQLAADFVQALRQRVERERGQGITDIETRYRELCAQLPSPRDDITEDDVPGRSALIGELRGMLAHTCIDALEPDVVILDEFQRFKHLLNTDSEQGQLAHQLFNCPDARVLLLSATPYKMYTLTDEADRDDHYADFTDTLRFLQDDLSATDEFVRLLEQYRVGLMSIDPESLPHLTALKDELERHLLRVMVRTERLASSLDRNGMLVERQAPNVSLEASDVRDFLALQQVTDALNSNRLLSQQDTIEYWKSAPYLFNFMEDYQLKAALDRTCIRGGDDDDEDDGQTTAGDAARTCGPELTNRLAQHRHLLLDWDRYARYEEIEPANARLRSLLADTVERGAWKLLWIPPSLPSYRLRGPFAEPQLRNLTKRLVFSSWAVVPKTIACLTSYDAERLIHSAYEDSPSNDPKARQRRAGLLRFAKTRDERLTGMPILCWLYPCATLACDADPVAIAAELSDHARLTSGRETGDQRRQVPSASAVLQATEQRIATLLEALKPWADDEAASDDRWYWAAPALLDLVHRPVCAREWFDQTYWLWSWHGGELDSDTEGRDDAFRAHVERLRKLVLKEIPRGERLGAMPRDLARLLARVAAAGPAVSMLRSIARVVGDSEIACDLGARQAAAQFAWGMRGLFNSPESMAVVRSAYSSSRRSMRDSSYWRRVLEYCVDGCLQAVLDEYVHVLRESLGLIGKPLDVTVTALKKAIVGVVSLRTSVLSVDKLDPDPDAGVIRLARPAPRMRSHFALRFGDLREENDRDIGRAALVREAFNSPFWPFVLATTSVGQEGLDFHLYCHAVVHWNLPSNPVDLEQREGRVHRYKGHAVRKNLARVYGLPSLAGRSAEQPAPDPWEALFASGQRDRSAGDNDLVPFWIFLPPKGGDRIERYVPVLPLSRDRERLGALRRSLAVYRMLIGHARQEELLEWLLKYVESEGLSEAARDELASGLTIDLSPR